MRSAMFMPERFNPPQQSKNTDFSSTCGEGWLTTEERVELAKQIEAGVFAQEKLDSMTVAEKASDLQFLFDLDTIAREGKLAKDCLIESSLGLVVSIAKEFKDRGLDFQDLVQEGNLALITAVERHNYKAGEFMSYASRCVRHAIRRAVHEQRRTITVKRVMSTNVQKLFCVQEELQQKLGRAPNDEELARELNVQLLTIKKWRMVPSATSFDAFAHEGTELIDESEKVEDYVIENLMGGREDAIKKMAEYALCLLTQRHADVLRLRYGLVDGTQWTTRAIAEKFGMPIVSVNKILIRTGPKLRKNKSFTEYVGFFEGAE